MSLICDISAIPDGGALGALPDKRGRDRLLLVRQGLRVYGYINRCPHHDRVRLGWRKDAFLNGDQTRLLCAAHGALFRLDDGVCTAGPCLGQALSRVALKIEGDAVHLPDSSMEQLDRLLSEGITPGQ